MNPPKGPRLCAVCGDLAVYPDHLRCRSCYARDQQAQRRKHLEARREYDRNRPRRPNPARDREAMLRRKYRITGEDYDRLLAAQGGVCAICRRPERKTRLGVVMALAVDHHHDTGRVRGLLCNACNLGLGKFDDNTARLLTAVRYLKERSH